MRQFGLIGKTLKHSFSKKYFEEKFVKESIADCAYDLYELESISEFPNLIKSKSPELKGLSVTIPYKLDVIPYMTALDAAAKEINAVNAIKVMPDGTLKGYNTDYYGFKTSLVDGWRLAGKKALVLGTGGASNAVSKALDDMGIAYTMVSRNAKGNQIDYQAIHDNPEIINSNELIINCTPLGTFPEIDQRPDLPYHLIGSNHLLFDLVYNPDITAFMAAGNINGAQVKNGYDMLVGQAEAAWKIWNE